MNLLKINYVKYGLLMCAVVVICLLVTELTGNNQSFEKSPMTLFYTFIAPAFVWYMGIKARKDMQKGKLTFKQGLAEGFKISLVYAIVSPFIFLIYYQINPAILKYVREAYMLTGSTDAMVIEVDMIIQFSSAVIFGTIYGAMATLFLKTK